MSEIENLLGDFHAARERHTVRTRTLYLAEQHLRDTLSSLAVHVERASALLHAPQAIRDRKGLPETLDKVAYFTVVYRTGYVAFINAEEKKTEAGERVRALFDNLKARGIDPYEKEKTK